MNLEARTAIEALRAGVPNRAAVRRMGTEESDIEQAFDDLLAAAWNPDAPQGLGVAGGFGAGKSHLLGYLTEMALNQDFVVSRVVISKETPLSEPALLFEAALRAAILPNRNDSPLGAALAALRGSPETLDMLEQTIAQPGAGFAPIFAAILYLLRRSSTSPEMIRRCERFLAGGRMAATPFRQALAVTGAVRMFDLRLPSAAALAEQRWRFAARLFQATGFAGWCLLLDEVELIGRYTPLRRALAYAWLATWLGLDGATRFPGIVAVYAITDDFAAAVIEPRQDGEKLPERLRLKGRTQEAGQVAAAIRHIERTVRQRHLRPPDDETLARICQRLREIYTSAYDWPAPPLPPDERTATRTMRQYIKSWITQWDMRRLSGESVAVVAETMRANYEETEALAEPPVASDDDSG